MLRVMLFCLLVSTEASAGWFGYDDYDDCMLGKMKGQDRSMYSTADKACKKQFNVEIEVWGSNVQWRFVYSPVGSLIRLEKFPEEYEITKGKFIFSSKPCAGLKNDDFDEPRIIEFKKSDALILDNDGIQCAKALSFMGKYK